MLSLFLLLSQIFLIILYMQKGDTRKWRNLSKEELRVSVLLIQYRSDNYIVDKIDGKYGTHWRNEKRIQNFCDKL
jgi:hypothetical protein